MPRGCIALWGRRGHRRSSRSRRNQFPHLSGMFLLKFLLLPLNTLFVFSLLCFLPPFFLFFPSPVLLNLFRKHVSLQSSALSFLLRMINIVAE